MQRTSSIPAIDQRDPHEIYRHVLYCLPGRRTYIFQQSTTTPKGHQKYP